MSNIKLKSVTIPNSIITIEDYVFGGCDTLERGDNLTYKHTNAYQNYCDARSESQGLDDAIDDEVLSPGAGHDSLAVGGVFDHNNDAANDVKDDHHKGGNYIVVTQEGALGGELHSLGILLVFAKQFTGLSCDPTTYARRMCKSQIVSAGNNTDILLSQGGLQGEVQAQEGGNNTDNLPSGQVGGKVNEYTHRDYCHPPQLMASKEDVLEGGNSGQQYINQERECHAQCYSATKLHHEGIVADAVGEGGGLKTEHLRPHRLEHAKGTGDDTGAGIDNKEANTGL